jgi:hypothetical protein
MRKYCAAQCLPGNHQSKHWSFPPLVILSRDQLLETRWEDAAQN